MTKLTTQERLALAVRAEVARRRADQAKERAVFMDRKVKPFMDAVERFEKARGRPWDADSMTDLAEVIAFAGKEGADVTFEMVAAAAQVNFEAGDASVAAASAARAVLDAWGDGEGDTVFEWVGVDRETFGQAVEAALAEGT